MTTSNPTHRAHLPRGLPDQPRERVGFAPLYLLAFARPRRAFEKLLDGPRPLRMGALAVLLTASLYTLMYWFLSVGGAAPSSFDPWLAIPKEVYYRYNVFLLSPSMFACWLLAAAVAQLTARAWSGRGTFENTAAVMGLGVSVASWTTLLHDLVGSFLGAVHVIDARAHELAMNSPTFWRALILTLIGLYAAAFVALFAVGIATAHRLSALRSLSLGALSFAVYQALFFVFNR